VSEVEDALTGDRISRCYEHRGLDAALGVLPHDGLLALFVPLQSLRLPQRPWPLIVTMLPVGFFGDDADRERFLLHTAN
jgi:hypothetical protein